MLHDFNNQQVAALGIRNEIKYPFVLFGLHGFTSFFVVPVVTNSPEMGTNFITLQRSRSRNTVAGSLGIWDFKGVKAKSAK